MLNCIFLMVFIQQEDLKRHEEAGELFRIVWAGRE